MKGVVGTGSRVRGLNREARGLIAPLWRRWLVPLRLSLSLGLMIGGPRSSIVGAAVTTRIAHFISVSAGVGFSCGVLSGDTLSAGVTTTATKPRSRPATSPRWSPALPRLRPASRRTSRLLGLDRRLGSSSGEAVLEAEYGMGFSVRCRAILYDVRSGCMLWPRGAKRPLGSGSFTQVSAGEGAVCGITTSKSIGCGSLVGPPASVLPDHIPVGRFSSISVGSDINAPYLYMNETACAVRTDRSLACWGNDQFGQTHAPDGRFEQVAVGSEFVCGLRMSGAIVCWGNLSVPSVGLPPSGRFLQLSVGQSDGCGFRADRTAGAGG